MSPNSSKNTDCSTPSYHFVGIGGIGMSGLARILLDRRIGVSGSDLKRSPRVAQLERAGAKVYLGQATGQIRAGDTLVYSSAVSADNPEMVDAARFGCRQLHRSDLLAELMHDYRALAVAGTHGKTTTSALLTWMLVESGLDPSFAIGGVVKEPLINSDVDILRPLPAQNRTPSLDLPLKEGRAQRRTVLNQDQPQSALPRVNQRLLNGQNGGHGRGEYFVAEADESDGTFVKYHPFGAIITNVEADHLDHYGTTAVMISAFRKFIAQVESPDHLFWCGDDPWLAAEKPPGISYGFGKECVLRAENLVEQGLATCFDVVFEDERYAIVLPLAGRHNVLNALAAIGLGLRLGGDPTTLETFPGVERRLEYKGRGGGISFYDDYAHHPTEVQATLNGLRKAFPDQRLVAIMQPHRYSRLQQCHDSFTFEGADKVLVTPVFGAGEQPIPGIDSSLLGQACVESPNDVVSELEPGDVVVTMGAGDITNWSEALLALL